MSNYENLFKPLRVGNLILRNSELLAAPFNKIRDTAVSDG